jgi:hypothetical protein
LVDSWAGFLLPSRAWRDTISKIQKRIGVLQRNRDFCAYSAWCLETRPQLHAHILFVGDGSVVERLILGALVNAGYFVTSIG